MNTMFTFCSRRWLWASVCVGVTQSGAINGRNTGFAEQQLGRINDEENSNNTNQQCHVNTIYYQIKVVKIKNFLPLCSQTTK